jgi:hypothetical protein
MQIKIEVFNQKQFKKHGGLKKTAKSDRAFSIMDIGDEISGGTDKWLAEVAKTLKTEYHTFESPYIFTHLRAISKTTNEQVFIFETVATHGTTLTTSPIKLRKLLQ